MREREARGIPRARGGPVDDLGSQRERAKRPGADAFHAEQRLEVFRRAIVGLEQNLLEMLPVDVTDYDGVPFWHREDWQLGQSGQHDLPLLPREPGGVGARRL